MNRPALALAALGLAGCAAVAPPAGAPQARVPAPAAAEPVTAPAGQALHLRCEDGSTVIVRFSDDTARLEGLPSGPQQLFRDAGGVRPQHSVWSNAQLRAEFGLGDGGRHALLHPLEPAGPPLHCQAR